MVWVGLGLWLGLGAS